MPLTIFAVLLAAAVGLALFMHHLANGGGMEAVGVEPGGGPAGAADPAPLYDTGFDCVIPWRDRADLNRHRLRWGKDAFVYQHEERDNEGRLLAPQITYTRYAVIALGERLPSLRAACADASPAFAALLRDMAAVDAFPAPEGLGIAFIENDIPHGIEPERQFQRLVDAAFVRLVGEPDALVYLRQTARQDSDHGADCARLLLEHCPERAAADGLPQAWAGRTRHPDTALTAALALRADDPRPLLSLALGHAIAERADVMQSAWRAVADGLTTDGLIEALNSASPDVFADAARRLMASGVDDIEEAVIRIGRERESHRREAAELLGRFPSSETDAVLVRWMASAVVLCAPFARALKARGSTAASALLVEWLDSSDPVDVDAALTWLGDLGAAEAVGPLRVFADRWRVGGEQKTRAEAAIAGILARTGAADGALTFVETVDGGLSVADEG